MSGLPGPNPSDKDKLHLTEFLADTLSARLRDARDLMPPGPRRDEETAWINRYQPLDTDGSHWKSARKLMDDYDIEFFEKYGFHEDGDA